MMDAWIVLDILAGQYLKWLVCLIYWIPWVVLIFVCISVVSEVLSIIIDNSWCIYVAVSL